MRELRLSGQLTLIVLSMDLVRVERLEAVGRRMLSLGAGGGAWLEDSK